MCRFGRQSVVELVGRRPTALESAIFEHCIWELLEVEYQTPPELRHED